MHRIRRKRKSCFSLGLCLLFLGGGLLNAGLKPLSAPSSAPKWQLSGSLGTVTNVPFIGSGERGHSLQHLLNPTALLTGESLGSKLSAQQVQGMHLLMGLDMEVLSGRLDVVAKELRELLIDSPNSLDLLERHARVAMMKGQFARANAYWELLTSIAPGRGDWLAEQTWCLMQEGDWVQAREVIDGAESGWIARSRFLLLRGICQIKFGEPLRLREGVDGEERSVQITLQQNLYLGQLLIEAKDEVTALLEPYEYRRLCAWVLHAGTRDVGVEGRGQDVALQDGLWALGEDALTADLIEVRSEKTSSLHNWAALLKASNVHLGKLLGEVRAHRYDDVLNRVRVLRLLHFNSPYLDLLHMDSLRLTDRFEEWDEAYGRFKKRPDASVEFSHEVGRQLVLMGRLDEAEALLRRGIHRFRKSPALRFYLAGCLALKGGVFGANGEIQWLVDSHEGLLRRWLAGSSPMHRALRSLPAVRSLYSSTRIR